jgi:hypothetical protein
MTGHAQYASERAKVLLWDELETALRERRDSLRTLLAQRSATQPPLDLWMLPAYARWKLAEKSLDSFLEQAEKSLSP